MRINNLFNEKKMVFSLEVFPPKVTSSIETIYKMLEELKGVNPDFISVTYGAGGAATSNRTLEIASLIKNKYNMEPVAHLTCIDAKEDEIKEILRNLKNEGIENILALRGDGNPDTAGRSNDFKYASDLIQFIKKTDDFNVSGACYPEGHIDCRNLDKDIENLKIKQEAVVSDVVDEVKHMGTHIMTIWQPQKLHLVEYTLYKSRFFVRAKNGTEDKARALFGDIAICHAEGVDGEYGFVTEPMTVGDFEEKKSQLDGFIARIFMKACVYLFCWKNRR